MPVPTDINSLSTTAASNEPDGLVENPNQIDNHFRQIYAFVADLLSRFAGYLKRDGTNAMTGALNMGSQKITALANGTVSTDAAAYGQVAAIRTDLADSSQGTSLVAWIRSATSAVATTLAKWLGWQPVNAFEFLTDAQIADVQAGTASLDLTTPLQAFLNAAENKKAVLPPGTYQTGKLACKGGMKLSAYGATLKAKATLAASDPILINTNFGGAANTTNDDDILIEGMSFLCDIAADRSVDFVSFIKCGNLTLRDVTVTGPKYIGLGIGGCKTVRVENYNASGCGKSAATAEGGAALWIGTYGGDGSTSDDIWVDDAKISDCEWSAIYTTGTRVEINNPHIKDVKEAGVFGTANVLSINGGSISGVTKKHISGSGIELGGLHVSIGGGIDISTTDNEGVSLTDVQSATIGHITTRNCRRDAASFSTASHISIVSLTASPNQPRYITIANHRALDTSSPAYAAVSVVGQSPGGAVVGVSIGEGCNYRSTAWASGQSVYIDPTYWGSGNKALAGTDADADEFGGYTSGRYYAGELFSPAVYATPLAITANRLYANPFVVRQARAFDRIAFEVQTAGAAGKLARVGIYRMQSGLPTELVLDAGTAAVDSTGLKSITINQMLLPGMYALVLVSDGTPTLQTANMIGTFAGGCVGVATPGTSAQVLYTTHAFAALPSSFGATSYASGSVCVAIMLRAA